MTIDTKAVLRSILCGALGMFLTMLGLRMNAGGVWEIIVLACVGIVIFTATCVIPRAIEIVASRASRADGWHRAGVGAAMVSAALTIGVLVTLTPAAFGL